MNHSGSSGGERTSSVIAKEFGVGQGTVQRAVEFAGGLDAAEAVSPGIREAVLSGEVKAPKKVIAEIRNLPEEKQKEAAGEALPVFVGRAVETQAQRDKITRKMKKATDKKSEA